MKDLLGSWTPHWREHATKTPITPIWGIICYALSGWILIGGIALAVLALSGCASDNQIEHEACLSYGFQANTEAYGTCRMQLYQARLQRIQNMAIMFPPGPAPAPWPQFHPPTY